MTPYSYRSDPSVPDFSDDRAIIVFDGYCVMCSGFMRFVLRKDRKEHFRFLPAQSPLGEALYVHYGLKAGDYDSVLLIENGEVRVKWDASLGVFENLGWPWKLAGMGRILPKFLAVPLYDFIARNRFNWFGRREVCMIPTAEEQSRFL
ncbi:thiol-disulfide oxidoreductase [Litorimonas cladophorae]|uniref:Thiol-disulfide oxidoreductase n=1 Tax=Litorimonas cladophorae TaxID=1220491 RepID=A0A918NE37_9PROT|nr:DCC1-like thiol-disulfide oxidoreductase family protein [Litorimonas cladophorae]GGX65808.1 thiol-disulfide oxidoreductase [Litorimonas cladophorae]